jgi:hypothetical protein
MISTVTTSTISTVTTTAMAGSVALIAILVLLSLLIQKELASTSDRPRIKKLSRRLNLAIIPLLFVFIFTVGVKILEIVQQ